MASSDDLSKLATPPSCTADFCLIPLGTPTASVSKEVAEVQRLLKRSGLNYSMHSAGTTVGKIQSTHIDGVCCTMVDSRPGSNMCAEKIVCYAGYHGGMEG